LGSLIQLAQPFGLTERLVRTSVARLAQDGWLAARRDGRRSEYRLTDSGQQRFAEATRRIYGKNPASWSGQWTLFLMPPVSAPRRATLRDELRWLGFGQVSPGVYGHPSSDAEQAQVSLRNLDAARDAIVLTSSSAELAADRRLVEAGWDLGDLARRYRRFVDAYAPVESAVSSCKAGVDASAGVHAALTAEHAFVIRTLLIHDYRKIHLRDPLLPPELLPHAWIGSGAYDLCRSLYARIFDTAEEFLSGTASTFKESLPAPDAGVYDRFGGLVRRGRA